MLSSLNACKTLSFWPALSFHWSLMMACTKQEVCYMPNIRGETPIFTVLEWSVIGTRTCLGYCIQSHRCVATTSDPSTKSCLIHKTDGKGWPCWPVRRKRLNILDENATRESMPFGKPELPMICLTLWYLSNMAATVQCHFQKYFLE